MTGPQERCSFEFNLEVWERENDKKCFVYEDEEILTENADGDMVWRCPHEAADGEVECVFHLPRDSAAKPDTKMVADAFLDITNGEREALDREGPRPARFLGAAFESLDLDTARIGDGRPIDLRHAEVVSAEWKVGSVESALLDAGGLSVRTGWDCDGVTFGGRTVFSGGEFGGDTWFRAEFGRDAVFDGAEFGGQAIFSGAEFGGRAWFSEAEFSSDAGFSQVEFGGQAIFSGAEFGDDARFIEAEFGGEAVFGGAEFGSNAWFKQADFGESARFSGAKFGGGARFSGAEFDEIAWFSGAEFGEIAWFRRAEFEEGAMFTVDGWYPTSQFQGSAVFSNATADGPLQFIDEYDSLPGRPYTFLNEVDFKGADIPEAEFTDVSFREAPTFEDADLTRADLSNSSFEGAAFKGANLTRADLSESDFSGAVFNDALLSQASLYGTDLTNARLYGARMDGAHVSDHTDFGVRNQKGTTRSSAIPFRSPRPGVCYDDRNPEYDRVADVGGGGDAEGGENISDYTRAAAVYAEIERVAEANADSELASRCYLWRKDMQRKRYWSDEGRGNNRERLRGGYSWLFNVSIRYGESLWRVIGIAVLVILGCAGLYDVLNLLEYSSSPSRLAILSAVGGTAPDPVVTFLDALYFSTLTFSTLGMGTFQPSGQLGRLVTILETLAGVVLLALLVFVVGRRATR